MSPITKVSGSGWERDISLFLKKPWKIFALPRIVTRHLVKEIVNTRCEAFHLTFSIE